MANRDVDVGREPERFPEILARMPVIDGDHIASLQICRDLVHPIERSLIKRPCLSNWTFDEQKLVALKIDKLFHAVIDQATGKASSSSLEK